MKKSAARLRDEFLLDQENKAESEQAKKLLDTSGVMKKHVGHEEQLVVAMVNLLVKVSPWYN